MPWRHCIKQQRGCTKQAWWTRKRQQLAQMGLDAIVATGIQKRFAKQIKTYIRRRLR